MNGLGKLKSVLRDRCPECGEARLQVRTKEPSFIRTHFFTNEEIVCPRCGYILSLASEKRRAPRNIDTEWD